jgi:hypothetical protein
MASWAGLIQLMASHNVFASFSDVFYNYTKKSLCLSARLFVSYEFAHRCTNFDQIWHDAIGPLCEVLHFKTTFLNWSIPEILEIRKK